MRFSLLDLFCLTALVCLFLVARQAFVMSPHIGVANLILRAHLMPPVFACLVGLIHRARYPRASVHSSAILGLIVAGLVAAELAFEIAEGLRGMKYWSWAADFPLYCAIVVAHASIGGVLSWAIGLLFRRHRGPKQNHPNDINLE